MRGAVAGRVNLDQVDRSKPSRAARVISVVALVGSVAAIVALGVGQPSLALYIVAPVIFATSMVSTPRPGPEPDSLADLSSEDWNVAKRNDKHIVILLLILLVGLLGLAWYLDQPRMDIINAMMWTFTAAIESMRLAYRVWRERWARA